MKKQLFTLAFALVAFLAVNTVNAQSLSSYTADFNESTSTLTVMDGKVGGFGNKTRSMEVALFIEVEASVDCSRTNPQGTTERTFYRFVENSTRKDVNGRGFGTFEELRVTASGSATCPGGWSFVNGGDAELKRAWVVITGYDANGAIIKQSEEIDIVWN